MANTFSPRDRLPEFRDRLVLGDEGLQVSPFCLGMVGEAETITAAFEAGINFFFITADMHWPLYEGTRRGIRELLARGPEIRDQIVVAGVCYQTQPEFCRYPFQELLDEIHGLRRLDVLIAGGAYAEEFPARLSVYEKHRRTNYLGSRGIGATFHDRQGARRAVTESLVDVAFVRYNPGHAGARRDLFPHLVEPASTLLFGFNSTFGYVPSKQMTELGLPEDVYWHPHVTDHYRFALSRPQLDGLLIGLDTPAQVAELADALEKGPLDEEEEEYLMQAALVAQGQARVEPEEQEAQA